MILIVGNEMMKIETRIWRDVSDEPTAKLVRNMTFAAIGFIPFSALAGACFALALRGGTEGIVPWQWLLAGVVVSLFIGLMAVGCVRLSHTIRQRVLEGEREGSQPQPGRYR